MRCTSPGCCVTVPTGSKPRASMPARGRSRSSFRPPKGSRDANAVSDGRCRSASGPACKRHERLGACRDDKFRDEFAGEAASVARPGRCLQARAPLPFDGKGARSLPRIHRRPREAALRGRARPTVQYPVANRGRRESEGSGGDSSADTGKLAAGRRVGV